jgi:hypothetical protein
MLYIEFPGLGSGLFYHGQSTVSRLYGSSCAARWLGSRLISDLTNTEKKAGRPAGTLGHIGCFSFYPAKVMGTFGDGGEVTTNLRTINIL